MLDGALPAPALWNRGLIVPETIRGYLASVHRSLEKTSRARKLSALRSFYRYLNSAGIFADNPADLVAHPKIEQKMPSFLTVDAVFHFLDALSRSALKREGFVEEGAQLGAVRIALFDGHSRERTRKAQPRAG